MSGEKIWVFVGSSFGNVYTERFVTHRFNNIQQAAEYYYKKDGNFEAPSDLCVAPLPYEPTTEESKLVSSAPYVLLVENGRAPAWDEPMYDVQHITNRENLTSAIHKVIRQKGENCVDKIRAGISFDLTKLVEQVSDSTRKNASQDLISKLGLTQKVRERK